MDCTETSSGKKKNTISLIYIRWIVEQIFISFIFKFNVYRKDLSFKLKKKYQLETRTN